MKYSKTRFPRFRFVVSRNPTHRPKPHTQPPPAAPHTPDPCASGHEIAATDCALTWHGITVYGAYDVGAGWVSHGMPTSPYNYEGESLVNRNGSTSRFLVAPNNLSQTGFGVRGKIG